MMAGFAAGVTEALCIVTPFEVVKIRLQQQKGMAKDKLLYKVCCAVFSQLCLLMPSHFDLSKRMPCAPLAPLLCLVAVIVLNA